MLLIHIQSHHRQRSNLCSMLRLHTRQQDRVPRVTESNGRRVPRTSNHQLGRDLMGEKTFGTVGRSGDPGDSVSYGSAATRLSGLQGKRLAAASLFPLHPRAGQHNSIHHHATLSTNAKSVHSGVPKLLVGETFFGKYVQRSAQSYAKISISFKSATYDP